MKIIYKYKVEKRLELPKNCEIIHYGIQNNNHTIWVEFEEKEQEKELWFLDVVGTGIPFFKDKGERHIQTIFEGPYVWHLYAWK